MGRKGKEMSVDVKKIIIDLKKQGKSLKAIGEIVNRPKSSIQSVINNFKINKTVKAKKRPGRPRALSGSEIRNIVMCVKKNPKSNAAEIAEEKKQNNLKVSAQTIRRYLNENGLYARTPRIKPLISKINKQKRLSFAKEHLNKSIEFWNNVLFSDESKFCVCNSTRQRKIWRRKGEAMREKNLESSVKGGGGSVMVWGCMSAAGSGNLTFIESTMKAHDYLEILRDNVRSSATNLGLQQSWIFQQDNDPKHTAKVVKEWLLYNVPKQLNHPPQSPDLNPIENLWEEMKRKLRKRHIQNKATLKECLLEEWSNIEPSTTRRLVQSMPDRLRAVIKAKGGPTKY